jgi:hypothetical protein
MKKQLDEVEMLDLAAHAEVAEGSLHAQRWAFGALAAITVLLAIISEAPFKETLALRVFAAVIVLAAVTTWLHWRFALHAAAICYLAFGVVLLVFEPRHSASFVEWIFPIAILVAFANSAYRLLKLGARLAAVHGKEWQKERAQVQQWLSMLINRATEEPVFEIATGSFWTGYFTYRIMIMNRGGAWVVARFKKGSYLRPLDYRILRPDAVTMAPGDKLNIELDKRTIKLDISSETHASLLRFTGAC